LFVGYLDQSPETGSKMAYADPLNVSQWPAGKQVFQWWGPGALNLLFNVAGRYAYGQKNNVTGDTGYGWFVDRGSSSMGEVLLADTSPVFLAFNQIMPGSRQARYKDIDGVLRPADYWRTLNSTANRYANPTVPYEIPEMNTTTGVVGPYVPMSSARVDAHPLVLNRAFSSVAEIGNAFRDMPWKTLDLFSDLSADAGLLALFSTSASPSLVASGLVSPNTPHQAVLSSLLVNSRLHPNSANSIDAARASNMAAAIISATTAKPLLNVSGLVTDLTLPLVSSFDSDTEVWKPNREVLGRSLADASTTGTWNLLLDVVVQSGSFPMNATTLNAFRVEGERRYWVNLSIDRSTGRIIALDPEPVLE